MNDRIQYISQGNSAKEQLVNIAKVLDAGCSWIQLRYKDASESEVLQLALSVKKLIQNYDCTFIINDYPEVAKIVDADGIHLGLNDMPISQARELLGANKIYGGTANTLQDVIQRHNEQCDYIGLGPFRFTATKQKLSPIVGLEGYKTIMQQLPINFKTPVYAIGGIEPNDIDAILKTGVYGVALSAAITHHAQQKQLINQLYQTCSHYI